MLGYFIPAKEMNTKTERGVHKIPADTWPGKLL